MSSALARALVRWQRAAGPYWPFVCAVPFLGDVPPVPRPPGRERLPRTLDRALAAVPPGETPAIFVDLPPSLTLPAAPGLSRRGLAAVPVFQRWVEYPAVVPCERTVAQLVAYAPSPGRRAEPRGVVFLLDDDRAGRRRAGRAVPRAFDNRYRYSPDRFPEPSFLLGRGVRRVVWLVGRELAADLRPYVAQLAQAGLCLEVLGGAHPAG